MKSINYLLILLFTGITLTSCSQKLSQFPEFLKEGHRGTRGWMPENSIPAMIKGVDLGAQVLEMDVHITRDGQVIVYHDSDINPLYTLKPGGEAIQKEEATDLIFYQMPYAEIRKYDIGQKSNPGFPKQSHMPAHIPLLSELIDSVETYVRQNHLKPVIYNIEIKASEESDGKYQPAPDEFISRVMEVVRSKDIKGRYYLQSFDMRQIREVHHSYPDVPIGFLTTSKDDLAGQLKTLGFDPEIFSPNYKLVNPEMVKACHDRNIKLIPWTVNTEKEIAELRDMGVDGIITDFPDLL